MSQHEDNPFLAAPRRLQKRTGRAELQQTPTEQIFRRSYRQIQRATTIEFRQGAWDVLVVVHHLGHAPCLKFLTVTECPVFFVLGRHESVPLCVSTDSAVSLRHALCGFSRTQSGQVASRVIDLSSSGGIRGTDDTRHESLAVCSSTVLRLGDTCLFILYNHDLARAETLPPFDAVAWSWPTLPKGDMPEKRARGIADRRQRRRSGKTTLVGLPDERRSSVRGLDPAAEGAQIVATLRFGSRRLADEFDLSAARLRDGCLLGRDLRCHINSRDVDYTNAISRVHCLLIEIDGSPLLVDIASTNGIYVDGVEHKVLTLSSTKPTSIELARGEQILTFTPYAPTPIALPPMRSRAKRR